MDVTTQLQNWLAPSDVGAIAFGGFAPCDHDHKWVFGRTVYSTRDRRRHNGLFDYTLDPSWDSEMPDPVERVATIYLSPEVANVACFFRKVVLWHECAHAITWRDTGTTGHTAAWRKALFRHPLLAVCTLIKFEAVPCLLQRLRD